MSDAKVLSNQKTILANQSTIVKNQKAILTNQTTIRKNQATILANQAAIKKNQSALNEILSNQKRFSPRSRSNHSPGGISGKSHGDSGSNVGTGALARSGAQLRRF